VVVVEEGWLNLKGRGRKQAAQRLLLASLWGEKAVHV
jgi:hypothetical protein